MVTEKVQNSELLVLTAKVGKPLEKFTWDTTVARRNPLMWGWFNLTDVMICNLPGVVVGPVKDGDQSQEQERGYLSILQ